jgi:hypothetical protein
MLSAHSFLTFKLMANISKVSTECDCQGRGRLFVRYQSAFQMYDGGAELTLVREAEIPCPWHDGFMKQLTDADRAMLKAAGILA